MKDDRIGGKSLQRLLVDDGLYTETLSGYYHTFLANPKPPIALAVLFVSTHMQYTHSVPEKEVSPAVVNQRKLTVAYPWSINARLVHLTGRWKFALDLLVRACLSWANKSTSRTLGCIRQVLIQLSSLTSILSTEYDPANRAKGKVPRI